MNTMRRLTIKGLIMNKSRTVMTIAAIMLSCALITVIAGIGTSSADSLVLAEMNMSGNYDVCLEGSFTDKNIKDISQNRDVDGIYYERLIGVARIPEAKSIYKPYMLVRGLSSGSMENCFNARLSEGRLPENDSELALSPLFLKYCKHTFKPGDKLKLELGDRAVSIDGEENSVRMRYTDDLADGEALDNKKTKEYTVVGILSSISQKTVCDSSCPCIDVYTLSDSIDKTWTTEGFSGNVSSLLVSYTDSAVKDYVNVTAQLAGITREQAKKHFDNDYTSEAAPSEYDSEAVLMKQSSEYEKAVEHITESNSFGISSFSENYSYLMARGIVRQDDRQNALAAIAVILILVVVGTSVFIIRNSISISITDKTKLYGMLSSVGATPRQIRNSVLFEGLVLTVSGIPLGLLLGTGVTFGLTSICGRILSSNLGGNELIFSMPLWALAAAAVIAAVTVFVSCLGVAVRASEIPPIEAVRQSGSVKLKKERRQANYRVPEIIRRLFGEGGYIAWKNMKRSRRQYRATVVSLALSAMIFLSVASFVEAALKQTEQIFDFVDYDISVSADVMGEWSQQKYEDGTERPEIAKEYISFFRKIASNSNVDDFCYSMPCSFYSFRIPSDEFYKSDEKNFVPAVDVIDGADGFSEAGLTITTLDEKTYTAIAEAAGKTAEELRGKAVIVNSNSLTLEDEDGNQTVKTVPLLKNAVGMTLPGSMKMDFAPDYNGDRENISIEIGAEISIENLPHRQFTANSYEQCGILIMQESDYINTVEAWYSYADMFIKSSDAVQLEADIGEMGFRYPVIINNVKAVIDSMNAVTLVAQIFSYGFIAIITLISLTNIFNTITTNMKLRQRELAMLRSVGMTNREFDFMIMLESIFCSSKALLSGMPLGLLAGWAVCSLMDKITASPQSVYVFPLAEVIICVLAITAVVGIIMYYSVSRIRKQNIIETIRNENI